MLFSRHNLRTQRRATVLVMVIGVLAMLFIMGSSLLVMARFERQTAVQKANAANLKSISVVVTDPINSQLREDLLGSDGNPYNRGWNVPGQADSGDTSPLEDFGNMVGLSTYSGPAGSVGDEQYKLRNGDLLLSSIEPYFENNAFHFFAESWGQDAKTDGLFPPANNMIAVNGNGTPYKSNPNSDSDADGDGVYDSKGGSLGVSPMFGGAYDVSLRVVPHGGMVLLDRLTHPSLLAQVIHPKDRGSIASAVGMQGLVNGITRTAGLDEYRLRRRSFLPENVPDVSVLPANDMRRVLPVTLGLMPPDGASTMVINWMPHFWPVDSSTVYDSATNKTDWDWWQAKMRPPTSELTQASNGNGDVYDRRHLLTTASSDDILRPQRDELRLRQVYPTGTVNPPSKNADFAFNSLSGSETSFYYVLNPSTASGNDSFTLLTQPSEAYGLVKDATGVNTILGFNFPKLRTQFSLRDVLVDPANNNGHEASYGKVVQLMAYYLAMIQHTTVPGTGGPNLPTAGELEDQLRIAAQLAVNTIDFADTDTAPTYFEWPPPPATPKIKVMGVEKQPFITEAFAKMIAPYSATGGLDLTTVASKLKIAARTVFAVELYNPYDVPIDLRGFRFKLGATSFPAAPGSLGSAKAASASGSSVLAPGERVVFANKTFDLDNATNPNPPFDNTATYSTHIVSLGSAFMFVNDLYVDPPTPIAIDLIRIGPDASGTAPEIDPSTTRPFTVRIAAPGTPAPDVVVDRMEPTPNVGTPTAVASWAQRPSPADFTAANANASFPSGPHPKASQTYIKYTSLQRHKEPGWDNLLAGPTSTPRFVPIYWHFTLSRQKAIESPIEIMGSAPGVARQPHDLLGLARAAKEAAHYVTEADEYWMAPPFGALGALTNSELPIAGFPVITADKGVDPFTKGTLAFPTTGSLLLVTRYAHQAQDPNNAALPLPMTVAATRVPTKLRVVSPDIGLVDKKLISKEPPGGYPRDPLQASVTTFYGQMQMVDNGHLPVCDVGNQGMGDPGQMTTDFLEGATRLHVPWGQLIYSYFTALPLEELFRPLDLSILGLPANPLLRIIDLPETASAANYYKTYAGAYQYFFSHQDSSNNPLFGLPLNDRIPAPSGGSLTVGAKVRGRININFAPWWVLDGLPMLEDTDQTAVLAGTQTRLLPLSGVPVPEIRTGRLDPDFDPFDATRPFVAAEKAGLMLAYSTAYEKTRVPSPPLGLPSAAQPLAKAIVAYRERRPDVDGYNFTRIPPNPGIESVGGMCDVIRRMDFSVNYNSTNNISTATKSDPIDYVRSVQVPAANLGQKPFAYVGYLQLVAPMVRLQDWVTVKNHVFTIYSLVGTTDTAPVYLRSQVTVDRTRCLYSNDLPERITETEPMGYYNSINDQK